MKAESSWKQQLTKHITSHDDTLVPRMFRQYVHNFIRKGNLQVEGRGQDEDSRFYTWLSGIYAVSFDTIIAHRSYILLDVSCSLHQAKYEKEHLAKICHNAIDFMTGTSTNRVEVHGPTPNSVPFAYAMSDCVCVGMDLRKADNSANIVGISCCCFV